jgi:hypothetical protein
MDRRGIEMSTQTLIYLILGILALIFLIWALRSRLSMVFG